MGPDKGKISAIVAGITPCQFRVLLMQNLTVTVVSEALKRNGET